MSDPKPAVSEWDRLLADLEAARLTREEARRRREDLEAKERQAVGALVKDFTRFGQLPTDRGHLAVCQCERGRHGADFNGVELWDCWHDEDAEEALHVVLLQVRVRAIALGADPLFVIDDGILTRDAVREAVASVVRHYATSLTTPADEIPF